VGLLGLLGLTARAVAAVRCRCPTLEHGQAHRLDPLAVGQPLAALLLEPVRRLAEQRQRRRGEDQLDRPADQVGPPPVLRLVAALPAGDQLLDLAHAPPSRRADPGFLGLDGRHPAQLAHRRERLSPALQLGGQPGQLGQRPRDPQPLSRHPWRVAQHSFDVLVHGRAADPLVHPRSVGPRQPDQLVGVDPGPGLRDPAQLPVDLAPARTAGATRGAATDGHRVLRPRAIPHHATSLTVEHHRTFRVRVCSISTMGLFGFLIRRPRRQAASDGARVRNSQNAAWRAAPRVSSTISTRSSTGASTLLADPSSRK